MSPSPSGTKGTGSSSSCPWRPEDRGFVIGKRGRTADALRTVLDAVARRRGTNCDVEIVD